MVTIKDVAKLAGVSPSTASRALHDNKMISPATKARVRKAMEELNYSPNFSAQNLVKRQSNTVAIVLPARESPQQLGNNPFFMQIIQGITSVCSQEGFMVSLATGKTEDELLASVRVLMKSGHVDKFIFLYAKVEDTVYQAVRQNDEAMCIIVGHDETKSHERTLFVDTDNVKAGSDVTQFLLERGYRQPLYICTDMSEIVQESRFRGFQKAVESHHISAHYLKLTNAPSDSRYLEETLKRTPTIDAFVCCDDLTAIYVIRLLEQLKIEQSLAFISFNNSLLAELESPALTSVEIFPYDLGETAAKLLFQREASKSITKSLWIPHRIVERESTYRR
ncbi:LacI family DNA-binding transcriptional regulator [Streptococcus hyovaginalis]|uniref:LacI family DNA-binding transcriptional regulator n=1 Tax=Streptococcus hyovaginalis TaxID=149015 RepID=UPI003AE062CE